MNFEEKTTKLGYVYKGKILSLRKDDILLPNGKNAIREIVEHHGGSTIYVEKDNKVLLVKQFRYAYKKCIWELPAGKLNENEDPLETARRELEEECGYFAKKIEKVLDIYPTPGYSNEIIRLYKASDLIKTKTNFDEDEFLVSEWIDKERIKEMIKNNEILDAKTLIALLYFVR